jgi:hypothetical protein
LFRNEPYDCWGETERAGQAAVLSLNAVRGSDLTVSHFFAPYAHSPEA